MPDTHEREQKAPCVPGHAGSPKGMMEEMMGRCAEMWPHMKEMCCGESEEEEDAASELRSAAHPTRPW